MVDYITGDIHDIIKTIETDSIDFIYTDPPFGITKATWDKGLDWENLFPEMWRVLKPTGIICLYAYIPFTYDLLQYEKPKYNYSWVKNNKTNFFHAKYQPLRQVEEIFIYYKKRGTYNPQMEGDKEYSKRNVQVGGRNAYYDGIEGDKLKDKANEYKSKDGETHTGKYPSTYQTWEIRRDNTGITRTDEQIDYFIKTYTNEGDKILDMTCNCEYVGNRCKKLKRKYLGVDLNIIR